MKPSAPRISFDGFKDPVRRPRYILWTLVAVLIFAGFMVSVLGITSTRWFCAEGCHKVQDDTIIAYERSSHARISCMACHMPVSANPVVFMLHKAEALGELYLTVTNNYELPLNPESHYALTMKSSQCTQCHNLKKRKVTPEAGILIVHEVHEEKEVTCAICHNRIAHKEDFKLTLSHPETKEPNRKHEVFMEMTACFRCHSQGETPEGGLEAPGTCESCHPADFDLKPESHVEENFFPEGHAKLAKVEASRVAAFDKKSEAHAEEGESSEGGHGEAGIGPELPKVEGISQCSTCHAEKFCSDCHGLPMPHPTDFQKNHGKQGEKTPKVCANCHGSATQFCDECHHGSSLEWDYRVGAPWRSQHPSAVSAVGASACFDCHDPTYCADCHVNGPPK